VEQHAQILVGRFWRPGVLSWRDAGATLLVLTVVMLLASGARQMLAQFVLSHQPALSISLQAQARFRVTSGKPRPASDPWLAMVEEGDDTRDFPVLRYRCNYRFWRRLERQHSF